MTTDGLYESDREAEAVFLGTLLRNPDEITDARDMLPVEALGQDPHQRVYRALIRLRDRRAPVDLGSLRTELATAGEADDVGDEFLGELPALGGTAPALSARIDQLRSLALARDLRRVAGELAYECDHPAGSPEERLERAQQSLARLAEGMVGTDATPFGEVVGRLFDEIDARRSGLRRAGTPTGFAQFDDLLCGGLPTGALTILAARPSVGKTSFAGNVTRNAAARGAAVLFVSLEQQQLELAERVMAGEARVNGKRIRTGDLDAEHVERLTVAADRARTWRLWVNDLTGLTSGQIAAGARRTKRRAKGLDLIVVDYLNLVRPENAKQNRNEQTGASALRLRDMARELGVPVLCLCQLNRAAAHDTDPPKLHHLRDSGEIEQHADVVVFLHRAEPWQPNRPDPIELHVAKHRNGPLGVVKMDHDSRVYTFTEQVPL